MKSVRIVAVCLLFALSLTTATALAVPASEPRKANNVTFNFVDVDLPVVTKFISDITGKNFIFDERVKGKVTIIAPSRLSVEDAYSLFTSVLELKGFTVVPSGVDAYKIIPSVEAKQRGVEISAEGLPVNETYSARLVSLRHISAEDALKFLQPLVSKDGHISVFGPGNLLLVVDAGLNIEKLLSIVSLIDVPSATDLPEVVVLRHSGADVVAKLLNEGFGKSRSKTTPGQPAGEAATAVADQRLNAVILFGDKGARESMKALIALVDIPSPEAQGRINVYFLENADAAELSKVLEGMLKAGQTQKTATTGSAGAPVTPFESSGGISITPDKATNSLVVVASPADYASISQIIKQLDRRRKQVYVEAMIIEASLDRLKELGTKWRAMVTNDEEPVFITGVGQMDSSAITSVINGLSGLSIGGLANFIDVPVTSVDSEGNTTTSTLSVPGLSALFSLNEFKDTVNVLSTPQILTSDNKEAEIVVGENVPIISKRERDATTSSTVLNSIERKDVGITLRITPQITEGDYVKLDLYQEISSVKQDSETILTTIGPTTTKRSTKTAVVVKDSQTVVIGGLMQDTDEDNLTKVPILGDIPVLGWLFKEKSTSRKKTNLIVFLTPHIIREADSLAKITTEKHKEFASASQQYTPGELVVKFREEVPGDRVLFLIAEKGASIKRFDEKAGLFVIKLRENQSVEDALEEFRSTPEVRLAEPNFTIKIK